MLLRGRSTLILVIVFATQRCTGIKSSCNASVNERNTARVTCIFNENIRTRQLDVNVYRISPKSVTVLSCTWDEGNPQIDTYPGVQLEGDIADFLTVKIMDPSQETFGGDYKCLVAKSELRDISLCTLNIRPVQDVTCSSDTMDSMRNTSYIMSTEKQNYTDKPSQTHHENNLIKLTYIFIPIVIIVAVVIVIICVRRRLTRNKNRNAAKTDPLI